MAGRDVDAHVERVIRDARVLPCLGLPARLPEDPAVQRADQSCGLGDLDELAGHQQAALRMLPADECFDADDAAAADVDDRLVVHDELTTIHPTGQLGCYL